MGNMFIIIEENKLESNFICICSTEEKAKILVNILNKTSQDSHYYYEEKSSYFCYMYLSC